jgi:hypothetical protein
LGLRKACCSERASETSAGLVWGLDGEKELESETEVDSETELDSETGTAKLVRQSCWRVGQNPLPL